MKKLIHLGIIAMVAISVSSCSKSTKDLVINVPNETPTLPKPKPGLNPNPGETAGAGGSTIFQFINQPVQLTLGDPGHNLEPGSIAVFYVLFADGYGIDPATAATLTTKDDITSAYIQTYDLISCDDADLYGVQVPDELIGKRFMFAVVEMDNQYTDKTIALYSDITINGLTTSAQLEHAFTVSLNTGK